MNTEHLINRMVGFSLAEVISSKFDQTSGEAAILVEDFDEQEVFHSIKRLIDSKSMDMNDDSIVVSGASQESNIEDHFRLIAGRNLTSYRNEPHKKGNFFLLSTNYQMKLDCSRSINSKIQIYQNIGA